MIRDRQVPWWAAVLLAVVLTVLGGVLDLRMNHGLGLVFDICYLLGCLAAVALVRRDGLFVPMVSPPPILLVTLSFSILVAGAAGGGSMSSAVLGIGVPLLTSFPTMALTTALVLVVGAVRIVRARRAPRALGVYPR